MSNSGSNTGHHVLVFDSGVGGLSVVSEIRTRLPESYLSYAADDAFRPYGSKTESQLRARLPGLLAQFIELVSNSFRCIRDLRARGTCECCQHR